MQSDAPPLVGRVGELAAVDRVLAGALSAPAAVLEIVGEPGIGKTRLLAELGLRAGRSGLQVYAGRGGELERDLPFGLAIAALDDALERLEPGRLNRLGAERRAQLASIFPALAGMRTGPAGPSEERYRTHYAIRALVELLARRRPLVLALDDVHWADAASLELLAHLIRRPPRAPLAVVIAYRPAQAPEALTAALLDAERAGALARIALGPLTAEEAEQLLAGRLDGPTRRALHRDSGGNPFYLEQLARSAAQRPSGAPMAPGPIADAPVPDVPRVVLDALRQELAALPERVRTTARAASVAGEAFAPRLAAAVAGMPYQDVLAGLDALIDCDVIRPAGPARFRFRHPIVRRAVYDSAPAAWLVGAHARAAQALADVGASSVGRAHHVERSAAPGDESAIATLTAAAGECLNLAPATAARFYEAALRLLPDDPAARDRRLGLLVPLSIALGTSGELETSRARMLEILDLLPADAPAHARLVAGLAAVEHLLGHYDDADARLLATLDRLGDGTSPEATLLLLELAAGGYFRGEWEAMAEHAERARRHAVAGGEDGYRAEAAAMLALVATARGDAPAAHRDVAEAAPLIDGLTDDRLARHLDACFWVSLIEVHLARYGDAARHLGRGIRVSRQTGQGWLLVQYHALLAAAFALGGRVAAGREEAIKAVEIARLTGVPNLVGWAQMSLAWTALRAGDLGDALAAGEDVERLLARWPTVPMMGGVCALSEARVEAGMPDQGRDGLLATYGGPGLDGIEPIFRPWAYEILTRAELAAGRPDAAADWAARACATAAILGIGRDRASALTAEAAVALARGDATAAAVAARGAARVADAGASPIHAGRARILAGEALDLAGDAEAAVELLAQAHDQLRASGAGRYADEAAAALRRLGRRPPRGPQRRMPGSGLAALTERERAVAELVLARLTNREIAARLYISEKTVERHMHNIFQKLGVDSRVAIARELERERQRAT